MELPVLCICKNLACCVPHLSIPNHPCGIHDFLHCRYYSLFTLGMLVMFECTVVTQRLRNLKELRSLQTPKQAIMVHRQGKWTQIPGDGLLPGDVISIGRPAGGMSPTLAFLCISCMLTTAREANHAVLTSASKEDISGVSEPRVTQCDQLWCLVLTCETRWVQNHTENRCCCCLSMVNDQAWQSVVWTTCKSHQEHHTNVGIALHVLQAGDSLICYLQPRCASCYLRLTNMSSVQAA